MLERRYPSLATFQFDGYEALNAVLKTSRYGSLAQAVAALTLFSHPDTVAQTGKRALFKTVRGPISSRGQISERDGVSLAFDDNKSPTDAFLWANAIRVRPRDVQFNHILATSTDPELYTNLTNLCVTPSFLAKLTDTDAHVKAILRYRSFELYGSSITNPTAPPKPDQYDELEFADCLPAIANVPGTMEAIMLRRPKDRTVLIARAIGWLFGTATAQSVQESALAPPLAV